MLVALAVVALLVVASGSVAADGIDVTVEYDGEEVADGEKVEVEETEFEVNVTVESEDGINSVYATLHNRTLAQGAGGDAYRFNTTHVLTTEVGPNEYTVVVKGVNGEKEVHRAYLHRVPTNVGELQEAIHRLEEEKNKLEEEIDELEEKREELENRNEELLVALNETEGSEDSLPVSAGERLPGFTGVGALVALLVAAGLVARRRR